MKKKINVGLPPGTITYTGQKDNIEVLIHYVEYDNSTAIEGEYKASDGLEIRQNDTSLVQWFDIRGLHNTELIKQIGYTYGLHPIVIENAVDVHQRPIYLEYKDGHFLSLRFLNYTNGEISRQNVSLYFGDNFILTFQENDDDLFKKLRERIKDPKARLRERKSDYLAYSVLDFVVDHYFLALDRLEEQIEEQEERLMNDVLSKNKAELYQTKKELLRLRKSVSPLREAIGQFSRSESSLIDDRTHNFIRDLYDHVIHITENIDALRDVLSGLQDLYISEVSLKMNKVMQFLTVVTTVFVPLSFLTGLYGMNFEHIPELKIFNGYFILWGIMLTLVVVMLVFFKRNKWI